MGMCLLALIFGLFCMTFSVYAFFMVLKTYTSYQKEVNLMKQSNYDMSAAVRLSVFDTFIYRLFKKQNQLLTNKRKNLQNELNHAGLMISTEEYQGINTLLFIAAILFCVAVIVFFNIPFLIGIFVLFMGGALSLILPIQYLNNAAKKRLSQIRMQMPDTLDMIAQNICYDSDFYFALIKVCNKVHNEFTQELSDVVKEIRSGRSNRDAFSHLFYKTNSLEIKTFVMMFIDAEKHGIPIKNFLQTQATQMRKKIK